MGNGRTSSASDKSRNLKKSSDSKVSNHETYTKMYNEAFEMSNWSEAHQWQRDMGMTGDEFDDVVMSTLSFATNAYLTGREYYGYTEDEILNQIETMDKLGQPLPDSIRGTRYVRADFLGSVLNDPKLSDPNLSVREQALTDMIEHFKNNPQDLKDFGNIVSHIGKNQDGTFIQEGNTAFGWGSGDNFGSLTNKGRHVKLDLVVAKGTKGCITNNESENEIILNRGAQHHFSHKVTVERDPYDNEERLVFKVFITPQGKVKKVR